MPSGSHGFGVVSRSRPVLLMGTILTAALSTACGSPTVERDPLPHTQTSELRYRLQRHDIGYSTQIPYTYTNRTDGEVLLDHCGGDIRPLLQVRKDGRWVDGWHPLTRACEDPPMRISPGGVRSDTLSVIGAPPGSNVSPNFVFEEVEGVYRLYWYQARQAQSDPHIPGDAWRISNPFVLAFR